MSKNELNLSDFDLDEIESIEFVGEEDTIDISVLVTDDKNITTIEVKLLPIKRQMSSDLYSE